MATPPDNERREGVRRATDTSRPQSTLASNEVTTTTPAYSDEVTTTRPAVGDDPLGAGPLEAGRSEPSSPSAVIGPITKRRSRTSPYQESSGELKIDEAATPTALGADGQPLPDKPKKPLWRRLVKGVLWTVAVLILLVAAAIGFFHTGPGKSVAKDLVEGALNKRYDGKVTIGDLDYALGGDVSIKDLVIAEHSGREVVHLHSLLLDLDWGSLLSKPLTIEKLAIDGLDLDLVQFADGTSNLRRMQKEPTKLPEQIVLQALDVKGVNVQLENPAGQKTALTDVAVAASLALDNPAGKLDLELKDLSGKVDNAAVRGAFGLAANAHKNGADLTAEVAPKLLDFFSKKLNQPLKVEMKPIQVGMKDGKAEMTFGGLVAGPLSIEAMRTYGTLPKDAVVGIGPGEQLLELTGLKIDHAALNALLGREALVSDIRVDAQVKGPKEALAVLGKVATDGGKLGLTGTINAADLTKPIVHLVLVGDDLDTTKIVGGEARPDMQTAFKATIDLEGLPPAHTLKVHADVAKTTVRGKSIDSVVLDLSGKGELLTLDGLEISAFGQVLEVDGELDRGSREFRAAVKNSSVLGDAIQRARDAGVLITPLPAIQGLLDVDLGVQGRLKPAPTPGTEPVAATPFDPKALLVNGRLDLSSLPIETLTAKGKIVAKDVVVRAPPETGLPDKKIGLVDIDLDLAVEGNKPDGLTGALVAKVGALDTGKTTLDLAEVNVKLAGLKQDITVTARDDKQALALDLALQTLLDLEKRHVDATFTKLDAKRGPAQTHLEQPVTVQIDTTPEGKQSVKLPGMKLALAGGTLDLGLAAQLSKDEANPGANKVDYFDLSLDLDGVDVGRLAALAKKSSRGLAGKLDASVRAQGTKDNPQVDFFGSLRGRMKTGAPFTAKFDGAMRDKRLDLDLKVTDRERAPLFTLDVMAPLNLPPGGKPSLGGGRFSIKAELPETTVARLAALSPNPLPDNVDPDATIGFALDLGGTTARPTGDWHLDFTGELLRRRGYAKAPARQKVAIAGTMRPADGGLTALDNDFDFHLDAGAPAYVAHHTHGTFARSPLLKGFLDKPWTLVAGLEKPLELAPLYEAGLAQKPIAGSFATTADLHGAGADVLGDIGFSLTDVKAGNAPRADVEGKIAIGEADVRITQRVRAAGLEALAIDAVVGVPGRGLRAFIKDRPRLMRAPVSGEVRLVEHAIAEWKRALDAAGLAGKVPELPGKVGGALVLGGDVQTPTAQGAFAWDGFDTTSGAPGRFAFELDLGAERAEGGLALGAQREITIRGGVRRADLKVKPDEVPPPLAIDLAMKAAGVDLLKIVPAFATAGKPWKVHGALDWDMHGKLLSSRDPAAPGLLPGSELLGTMQVGALDIEVPDTDRHIEDGRIALTATHDALELTGIELHEARLPHVPGLDVDHGDGARWVKISGRVPWQDLKPSAANLAVETRDWLILGRGFDSPEGELDIAMNVAVRDLAAPVKKVDVTIASLDLYSPDRFIRAHYPQFPAYDDVVYLDESKRPAGKLPAPAGQPAPPDANATPNVTNEPATAPPAPDPNAGFDVALRIPDEIHVVFAGNSPIEIKLKGAMDVSKRGNDLALKGRLDVTDGQLDAMGRPFKLVNGAITADGGIDTAKAEMLFAYRPNEIALRDIADGAHHDLATITVRASAKTGLQTVFGGVSGPYLLDMATLLNTGRARMWGLPDVPSSETVRFGNPDQGLVNTFIQTNLRNLVFMDRANGWSESQEEPDEYGRLRFFDMQRFVADGGARVRLTAQPPSPGQNRMELGYDWMLAHDANFVFGFGPHLGIDLRAGLGFTIDFSSKD